MLKKIFKRFCKRHTSYDLRKEVATWVEKNIGVEFVEEALDKYDKINEGIPIGGFRETVIFLDMIEQIKEQMTA